MIKPLLLLLSQAVAPPPDSVQVVMLGHAEERVQVLELGHPSPERPTLVLVHGSPGDAWAFKTLMQDTALRRNYHIISVDRPGYGGTPPRLGVASLQEQSRRMHVVMRYVNRPAILCGHSYGGPLVLQMAADYPAQTAGLVMVGASVDPALEEVKWIQRMALWPGIRQIVPRFAQNSNLEILALMEDLKVLQQQLGGIRVPAAIVHGGKDSLVPAANVPYMQQHLTAASVMTFLHPEEDHFIPFTHPGMVVEAINAVNRQVQDR